MPSGTISCGNKMLNLDRVCIMGILNITPDSFSDGGRYYDLETGMKHAKEMINDGAEIIDVGGESTRPFSEAVGVEEELDRIMPFVEALIEENEVIVSVDTYKPEVAKRALDAGTHMINDVYGLRSKGMAEVIEEYDASLVIMHMQGTPKDMQKDPKYQNVVEDVSSFFQERTVFAEKNGIDRDRLILDPGIGFGKTTEHNLQIINNLEAFKKMDLPIMIGASRKSFIGNILNSEVDERLEGTIAANVVSIINGANIIRVHDVAAARKSTTLTEAIINS